MELALKYYEEAGDHLSMVRVLCFQEEYEKAAQVASESNNRAACYHLARQYEAIDDIQLAVQFFTRAQAYANAIRICKVQCTICYADLRVCYCEIAHIRNITTVWCLTSIFPIIFRSMAWMSSCGTCLF